MNTQEEKLSLLSEMIAFSIVDGRLHDREYDFLLIIALELSINKADFNDLFHKELPTGIVKSEFKRIQQFYRLALLMHCDGVLHKNEEIAIRQIAINMGLNPHATQRILELMKAAPNAMISPKLILKTFQEQHN